MKNKLVCLAILIIFLLSGYYILTTSSLVRFWADDFCSSVLLRNNGYWQSQITWWNGWTGRYSYIAFLDLVELFGLIGAQILPLILYVLFLASLFMIFELPVSLLLTVVFLLNSPNIIQSFYWMTGSLNYFAPFIFLNCYLALFFRKSKKYVNIIAFVLMFIAVGFSESFGVASVLFLTYLYLVTPKIINKKLIVVGLFATILSLGLMYLAPGNAVRSSTVSHPDGIVDLVTKTFVYSKWYLIHLLYIKEFVISILTIVVGAFVFCKKDKKYFENPKATILHSMMFIVGVTLAVVGLTYQAMNWEPPMRVMTIANYMIIYSVIIASIALNQMFGKYIPNIVSKIIFVVLVIMLTFQLNKQWGSVKQELKFSADSPTYVAVGKLDGLTENGGWVKSCIDGYYNLNTVK